MSISEIIASWKKKAEIDYFPLFISLWLSLNAWMKDHCCGNDDRCRLDDLKKKRDRLFDKFDELIYNQDAKGISFKGNFAELYQALENANILYNNKWKDCDNWKDKIISFESCPVTWKGKHSELESIVKTKHQRKKIKIVNGFWVEDDTQRLFGAYMEIVYQIRCALFHGDLAPNHDNERVIKQLYLTLSAIMEHV